MKPGSLRYLAASLTLIACITSSCHARSRVWEAQVRQAANSPCFTIEDAPETKKTPTEIGALSVFEVQPGGREVWALSAKGRDSLLVRPAECLSYGHDIPGTNVVTPSSPLAVGKAYGLSINASLKKGKEGENRRYRAYFCLTSANAGNVVVHQVQWDKKAEQWRWDVCGLPNES